MKPIIKNGLITIIRFYQQYLSALKGGPTCRFVPTCSAYAIEAITKYGALKGSALALWRIPALQPIFQRWLRSSTLTHTTHKP